MSLDTYSNLQTSIANFLARDDLTTNIPDFISLAEARMSRELDTRSQEASTTISTVAGTESYALPTDLREIRVVKINNNPNRVLDFATPDSFFKTHSSEGQGTPVSYTIIGTNIHVRPIPDSVVTIEVIFGNGITALSDSNTSNTVLTRHPDCYLYGSLVAAHTFLMDEARATQYDALFSRALTEVKRDTQQARFGGGALTMKQDFGAT